MPENAPVAVVTGASRGAGRGIARALGSHGCTVYVTGRSERPSDSPLAGTIYETAEAVTAAGGTGIPVRVDHGRDEDVRDLFARVAAEQGRLDILVNNAFAAHDAMAGPGGFWEKPVELVDMMQSGLRGAYTASYYGAPLLVTGGKGLIVFTSASGAAHYVFGPAYGAHKAGLDKFAADMAVDLKPHDVAALSIWMGALKTERLQQMIESDPAKFEYLKGKIETPEFTGHIIWALYRDPDLMSLSGQTLIGAEAALTYGITDEGGVQPPSYRDTHKVAPHAQYPNVIR